MGRDDPFAQRLRELLAERGLSYRAAAGRSHYSASFVHALAHGTRRASPDVARRLDQVLGTGGELEALARGLRRPLGVLAVNGWHHADNETLAALLLAERPSADNATRLAHEWLITDPPQVYELRSGRRVGIGTVEQIVRRVHQLRELDDHIGGSETQTVVMGELRTTATLLREAAYTESVGRRLLTALADLAQLAGWVVADAGHHDQARHLYAAGVRAGHGAGDQAAAASNLSSLAYLESNVGDPHTAVTLARSAWVGVNQAASAPVRALVLERLAWAHASAADAVSADHALGAVGEAHRPYEPGVDPAWTYWLTDAEVEIMAGRVWTQLRRPLRAVPILEHATAGYGADSPRETALYLTWLAEALLQAGEVERAAAEAGRALRLARAASSQRALDRIEEIRTQLSSYRNTTAVAVLEDEYHTP